MHLEESLSDVAASSAHLTVNLQPLVQEDMTLVESRHTGGLGEDCVLGALWFCMRQSIAKPMV